jgi:hypothetical protein
MHNISDEEFGIYMQIDSRQFISLSEKTQYPETRMHGR